MADVPGCVYINGEFVQPSEARISVFDVGFVSGVMVFDVMAGWQGWIFKLDPHIDRFYRSTHATRMEMPYTKAEFRSLFIETYRRGGLKDAFIECIATPGDYSPGPLYGKKASVIIFLGAVSLERSAGEDRDRRERDVCPHAECVFSERRSEDQELEPAAQLPGRHREAMTPARTR